MTLAIQFLGLISLGFILVKTYQLYVLRRLDQDFKIPETKMEDITLFLNTEHLKMESHISTIAQLGNVATLFGLIGTIVGLFTCFYAFSEADAGEKARVLKEGIQYSMDSTIWGLVVGLTSGIAYSVLNNRVNRLSERLFERSVKLIFDRKIQKTSPVTEDEVRALQEAMSCKGTGPFES